MSETYTATATPSDGTIVVPEDGDEADAASVRIALEELADWDKAAADKVFNAEILTRWQWRPFPIQNCTVTGTTGGSRFYLGVRPSSDGAYSFGLELDLAHGAELNQVRVYVHNTDDSAQSLKVYKLDFDDLLASAGGFTDLPECTELATDTSLTVEQGDLQYLAASIGGTEIVDRTACRYYAIVSGTAAGGVSQNTLWVGCRVLTEGNALDKGAA